MARQKASATPLDAAAGETQAVAAKPRRGQQLGPIEPHVLYPLEVFRRLSGLGESSMRIARRKGLAEYRYGGRKFILGADFLEFIKQNSGMAPGPAPTESSVYEE